jgi:hypothetical protein
VVSVHKRDLHEILGLLRKHNQDKFMRALHRIREEREADQADVEKIISDQFKVLETKSDELKNKYTSLFSKAKLSVIEQYESSREQMYVLCSMFFLLFLLMMVSLSLLSIYYCMSTFSDTT